MRCNLSQWSAYRLAARGALCLAVAAACAIPASADQWNKRTIVTFNEPVEVPGRVLAPGTYVFQLLNSSSDRDIVQIWNQDQNQLDDTVMAVPDYRVNTPGKTVITFDERASNNPEALKSWFYPGDNYGVEFVYPHRQAERIASRTNETVLATRSDLGNNGSAVEQLKNAPISGVTPAGEDVDLTHVVQPAPHH